jgi:GSCFA family
MPYRKLPPNAFWKLCRETDDFRLSELYQPAFQLAPGTRVATAGSCFAQHIGRYIRCSDLELIDVEPAPKSMHQNVAARFGYGLYSARYGNIYTARQLRQLLEDTVSQQIHECAIWQKDGRYFDALRPACEPDGFASVDELRTHRLEHLKRVKTIFETAEVFVFTLGLTETWMDRESGIVFPTAPGVIAGHFDSAKHKFANLGIADVLEDLSASIALMRTLSPELRILLTVSPVPLTATASGAHILAATTYSKSVLRAAAGELVALDQKVDYFPSFEIITGVPFGGQFYDNNLRTVTDEGVLTAMTTFFSAHSALNLQATEVSVQIKSSNSEENEDDVVCEEALLEAFASR